MHLRPKPNHPAQAGFTLIEILMVVMLVGILAAFAVPQFIDFRGDATDAAVNGSLGALRTAIANQTLQMRVRCNALPTAHPTAAQLNGNDITIGGSPCTSAQVGALDRALMAGGAIPDNAWG